MCTWQSHAPAGMSNSAARTSRATPAAAAPMSTRRLDSMSFLSRAVQHASRERARVTIMVDRHRAVDDHVLDAHRVLVRVLERGAVDDAIRIEDRHVG